MSELALLDESKEWEHSEPGISSPPPPRIDEDGSDDADREGGWRRETPPIVKELESKSFAESAANNYITQVVEGLQKYIAEEPDAADKAEAQALLARCKKLAAKEQMDMGELSEILRIIDPNRSIHLKGGNKLFSDRQLFELRNALGLEDEADGDAIISSIRTKFGELADLRDAVSAADQEKMFAEKYPQYWEEHRKLMERDRENGAHRFAESVAKVRKAEGYGFKETKQGLSSAALSKIEDAHKKLSENALTVEDFEECIRSIVNGGVVMFGEIGSTAEDDVPELDLDTPAGVTSARKVFAEAVAKYQRDNPDAPYMTALSETAKKHPDLAEAYRKTMAA
jgi:hypothetical protein